MKPKKWSVVLLALTMILTLIPTTAFAIDPVEPNYGFIPNSGEASVSKVDLVNMTEVARYYTEPRVSPTADYNWRTSRIAMDADGNAWVLNTGADGVNLQGSVVRIQGDTSSLTTTHSYPDPVLPFGTDEAVKIFDVGGLGDMPRAIAIDSEGYIWIGFYSSGALMKFSFDGTDLILEESIATDPKLNFYEMKFDPNDVLYISSRNSTPTRTGDYGVWSFDPDTKTFNEEWNVDSPYSLLIDPVSGQVYATSYSTVLWIKGSGTVAISGAQNLRGMAFDGLGKIWIASTTGGSGGNRVCWYDIDAGTSGYITLPVGTTPVGVGLDAAGLMWAICRTDGVTEGGYIVAFDPADGGPKGSIRVGYRPYAYGEFVVPLPRYCIEGTKLEYFHGPRIEVEPLEDWSIYLYNRMLETGEEPGLAQEGLLASTTTDENGDYSFCGLLAGTYYVYEMYDDCYGPYLPTSGMIEVTLPAEGNEGNAVDQDFINTRGAIRGKKVLYNGEGSVTNTSNTALSGWDIYLFNRQLEESEIPDEALEGFLAKTTTDGFGGFIFTKLCPGTYFVYEEVRDGWVQTWPSAGFYERTVTKGNVVTNNFFGNMEEEFFDIAGYKLNADTEEGIEGWTIKLYKWMLDDSQELAWIEIGTDITDEDGKYCFEGLEAGEYKVEEEMEDGWIQLEPEDDIHLVTLPEDDSDCEEETDMYNFVNAELFDLCGFKYGLDWKGFMMDEWPTDNPLEGWTIILEKYDEDEEEWVLVGTDPTDELGKYCFTGLRAGEYRLSEEGDEEINGYWMMDGKYWLQVGPDEDYIYADLPDDAVECGECCEDDLTVMCPEPPHRISLDFYNLCYKDETAWMFGDTSHIGLPGLTSNNWGWSENLGIVSGESYTIMENVPIYAAAGLNDITKGYLAGTLDIYWDGSKVIVQNVEAKDWTTLEDMKIWIGNSVLPSLKKGFTNAPGKLIIDPNIDYTKAVFVAVHFESFAPCGFH